MDKKIGKNSPEKRSARISITFWIVLFFAILLIVCIFFYDPIMDAITAFGIMFLAIAFIVSLIALFIISLIQTLNASRKRSIYLIQLSILIVAILVVVFVPLRDFRTIIDFKLFEDKAMTVIDKLDSGELEPSAKYEKEHVNSYVIPSESGIASYEGLVLSLENNSHPCVYFCQSGYFDTDAGYLYIQEELLIRAWQGQERTIQLDNFGVYLVELDLGDGWCYISRLE